MRCWFWKVADDLHLLLERADASTVDLVPQELERHSSKLALRRVDQYAVVAETLKDRSQVLLVLLGT